MENALIIDGLTKQYSDFTLNNVSFSLPKGMIMGLIGENGAGKTTTIKAILNLIKKDGGKITLLGKDSCEGKETHEAIGVVFDENKFHEGLTPEQLGNIMKNIYKNWDMPLYDSYLARFNLPADKKIKDYSRGMKTKLAISVALSHHPDLLILDEATSGLDPVVREDILDIFLEFIQDENHSILISSHTISDLEKIADYITFIHQGSIEFTTSKDELLEDIGILKTSEDIIEEIPEEYIIRIRKYPLSTEALIKNRKDFIKAYPDLVVDYPTIEEIMLFYIKGERL